jgi:uncharacterized protein
MATQCSEQKMPVDVFELAARGERIEGEIELARMPRLAQSLLSTDGTLQYEVRGLVDADGHPAADLSLRGRLMLECQRCNFPLEFVLERCARFRFVHSEQELDTLPLEDDEADVIVGSHAMDLTGWVEDEAILSLPLVPRHQNCNPADENPDRVELTAERRSPFAVLAALKGRVSGGSS